RRPGTRYPRVHGNDLLGRRGARLDRRAARWEGLSGADWLLASPRAVTPHHRSPQSTELHLLERRAAQYTVRAPEGFPDLEVIVARGDDETHGFAGRLDGCGEFTRLPLEFRRFQRAVGNDHRRSQSIDMPLC